MISPTNSDKTVALARHQFDALQSTVQGSHLKIDETPIKAGRTKTTTGPNPGQGKMKTGWLWPVLGEQGDIAFGYSDQRGAAAVKAFLGEAYQGTIQTDGYTALSRLSDALEWRRASKGSMSCDFSRRASIAFARASASDTSG